MKKLARRLAKIGFIRKGIKKLIWALDRSLVEPQLLSFAPPLPLPPNTIPQNLIPDFTLDNAIKVAYSYCAEVNGDGAVHNSAKEYKKVFKQIKNRSFRYYGAEINAFYAAFERYTFSDKTVLVWGLAGCNCEALSIYNNARKVYVVDYNKPICDHPQIEVLTHEELNKKDLKTDFAISYSSFEHDGLGRYGDPIDPIGDLKAMKAAHNSLKEGGILFLGVPLGKDLLCWNLHRIYGKIRLPLLLKGWRCEEIFDIYDGSPFDESIELGQHRQSLMVLRKINDDYPSDEELNETIGRKSNNAKEARNNQILAQINQFVLDYKNARAKGDRD
ncbi:MAG: DUF268 domain-containing protein [Helicobacteraceae bacterium]|jgi:SAM-dependent methyltransferase|nr:DUF268 domain-containing protein [Helicobacteraceae bacterium]